MNTFNKLFFILACLVLVASCKSDITKKSSSDVSASPDSIEVVSLLDMRGTELLAAMSQMDLGSSPGVLLPCKCTDVQFDDIVGSSEVLSGERDNEPCKNNVLMYLAEVEKGMSIPVIDYSPDCWPYLRLTELGYASDEQYYQAVEAEMDVVDGIMGLSHELEGDGHSEYGRAFRALHSFYLRGEEFFESWPFSNANPDDVRKKQKVMDLF